MTTYDYGSNVPGYLPDGDFDEGPFGPGFGFTFDEAKRGLIAEMLEVADHTGSEDEQLSERLIAATEDVNLWSGPDSVVVCSDEHDLGRSWWIIEVEA